MVTQSLPTTNNSGPPALSHRRMWRLGPRPAQLKDTKFSAVPDPTLSLLTSSPSLGPIWYVILNSTTFVWRWWMMGPAWPIWNVLNFQAVPALPIRNRYWNPMPFAAAKWPLEAPIEAFLQGTANRWRYVLTHFMTDCGDLLSCFCWQLMFANSAVKL